MMRQPGILFPLLLASLALVLFGHSALAKGREDKSQTKRRLALIALSSGYIMLGVSGWGVLRGMLELGYVDSAILSLHTFVQAENSFAKAHPAFGYTCNVSELAAYESPPTKIIAGLAQNHRRNGYEFEVRGCCGATARNGTNVSYQLIARPLLAGMIAYCSDQTGVVRYDETGSVENCLRKGPSF